jgi:predicted N-acetyltransferase YhbS
MLTFNEKIKKLTHECFESELYVDSFPLVFKQKKAYFAIYEEKEEIISFVAGYPFFWKKSRLKGACLGSISTKSSFRGQGLAGKLIREVEDYYRKNEFDFSFLFSSDESFYQKRGYQACGKELFYAMESFSKNPQGLLEPLPLQKISLNKIKSLYENLSSFEENEISFEEFEKVFLLPHTFLFEENSFFCFLNKGIDFSNVLHGWNLPHREGFENFLQKLPAFYEGKPLLMMAPCGFSFKKAPLFSTSMLWYKALSEKGILGEKLFHEGKLYPRTIMSC